MLWREGNSKSLPELISDPCSYYSLFIVLPGMSRCVDQILNLHQVSKLMSLEVFLSYQVNGGTKPSLKFLELLAFTSQNVPLT